jgi:holo-[acyl-carrier protein] synthase
LKALGTGWQKGIRWKDVEVIPDELGKPQLVMYRKAKQLFDESGAQNGLVTITHADKYAVAFVVLET